MTWSQLVAIALVVFAFASPAAAQDSHGPREMLNVMQIDDSLLAQFLDERPVEGNEEEPLLRLVYRMGSFSRVDLDQWAKPISNFDKLSSEVEQNRFQFFQLEGTIEGIEQRTVLPELVQRMGFSTYHKVWMQSKSNANHPIVVYAKKLPTAWDGTPFAELVGRRVRAQGMLLKTDAVDGRPLPIFVTPHIGWFPIERTDAVPDDWVVLSQIGVDVGRLPEISHKTGMKGQDRESFYQMLAAVHHSEPSQFKKLSRPDFDIARFLRTPDEAVGELYSIKGLARRAQLIRVNDKDINKRFGLDHYWEIEVFVETAKPVRFLDDDTGEYRVFKDDYPFVLCVPEVPSYMETGEDIHVPVEFSGFFFKIWAYRTEFMSGLQTPGRKPKQLSPLMIGPTVVTENRNAGESQLSLIIAALFIGMLGVTWFLLWRASISDRKYATKLFKKNLPEDQTFADLN